ncbi:MAG: alpha-L-fucosidase [Kiritimatiellae bacterium]|nr:alpha-L-fucosidase [Kiritimatiellia bacterium]
MTRINFLFAIAILAFVYSSPAEDSLGKIAIIKADDIRGISANWNRFFAVSKERGVKVSAGIICNSLQGDKSDYLKWLRTHHTSGFVEFWNHGWDHKQWKTGEGKSLREFSGCGYDHQKKHFEDSQELMKRVLGVAPAAFGSPYNAIDADTIKVMQENTDMRLLFCYGANELDDKLLAPMRLRGESDGTGRPNFEKFKMAYAKSKELSFTSIQFHPNSFKDQHFAEYGKILDFLITEGWSFVLPSEYIAMQENPQAEWLKEARIGAFMHFLPNQADGPELVDAFDVNAVAEQLESMGARYFVFTLGQNSGWFNSPNSIYDRALAVKPGDRCAKRDLPLELYKALNPRGIRLMLYLPCQTPNRDILAQKAFGLPEGPKDQPLDIAFAKQWAKVIHEWSARYGDKVSGWWFDGGYKHIHFNEEIARIYADAVKRGNPQSIVTFNPGVRLIRYMHAEDYTAGELNEPFEVVPTSRWVDGSQWHALTYFGSKWGKRDLRFKTKQWETWVKSAVDHGGAVTLDMGPNMNPQLGPIGVFSNEQVDRFRIIANESTIR